MRTADAWGVVANEACAAGLPVLITPEAGAARELVVDGVNGYVLELDVETWAEIAARLIADAELYQSMSRASRESVREYTFDRAAAAFRDAIGHVFSI